MASQTWKNDIGDAEAWLYNPVQAMSYTVRNMEIIFILDGELEIRKGSATHRLKKADILLINPPASSYERVLPDLIKVTPMKNCYFLLLRISPFFLSTVFNGKIPVFDCDSSNRSGDYNILRSFLAEIASEDTAETTKGLMFYSRLYRLLEELRVNFISIKEADSSETEEEEKRRQMIYTYIRKHYRETISLDDIADVFSLNPQYFSRYFKKIFHINFYSYLKKLRLEAALKELIATDKPVTAIAYDNGFPNLPALIKEMKDTLEQTPTSYRKAYQIKEQDKNIISENNLSNIDSELVKNKLIPFISSSSNDIRSKHIKISVNAQSGDQLQKPWQEVINLGFATDFEKTEFTKQIKILQDEAPFRYARFQGIFGRSMLSVNDTSEYTFAKIDRVIDILYSVQLLPFIEIGFKPAKIAKDINTQVFSINDEIGHYPVEEYEKIISNFMKHAINRYGLQEVSRWRFEYWQSRNDQQNLLDGDINVYIDQFFRISTIIKKLSPATQIGGPGFPMINSGDTTFLGKLIRGLKGKNCLPNFFSIYTFNSNITKNQTGFKDNNNRLVLYAKDELAKNISEQKKIILSLFHDSKIKNEACFYEPSIYITEWNFDFTCRNVFHDSLFKAPFIIKNVIDAINNIEVLSYLLASDISAEHTDSDAPLFGGPGLISRNGIRKPAFFAYQFLSKLGVRLLSKGDGYIITAKSNDEFVAILFNYKYITNRLRFLEQLWLINGSLDDYFEDNKKCFFNMEILNISPGRYKLRQYILNSSHGSIYDTWMGLSTAKNLQPNETKWLERTCFPDLRIDFLTTKGILTIDCELEPNEVRLLEISRILE